MDAAPPPDPIAGLFETLLVAAGRPIELDAHLERLRSSLELLGGPPPPDDLREIALARCRDLELGRLRLTVDAGPQGLRAEGRAEPVEPEIVFPDWSRAAKLRPLPVRGGLGAFKWADRDLLARAEAGLGERELPLIVDEQGAVLEASRANLFAIDGETLLTPPTDGRILPGIARTRAIEVAVTAGIEVREVRLTIESLATFGGAFLTGSVRGVEPVSAIDEVQLRPPGQIAETVASALRDRWLGGVRVLQPS